MSRDDSDDLEGLSLTSDDEGMTRDDWDDWDD